MSHKDEAERLLDELHEWQSREGETDATMITVALEAQTQATLALVEAQEVANEIAGSHLAMIALATAAAGVGAKTMDPDDYVKVYERLNPIVEKGLKIGGAE